MVTELPDSASEAYLNFELIALHHDISTFDCRNMGLNNFLHIKALAETQQYLSRTYVLLDEDTVIGYFTLYEKYGFGEHPYGEWLLLLPLADVENAVEIADSGTNGTAFNP